LALALAALSACASVRSPEITPDELTGVPFFPQEIHECGPAALATALAASGVEVTPADLEPKVYIPGRRGSLQTEMIAAARQYERLPYVLDSKLEAIAREVQAGRPVLVLQNLGLRSIPRWHYAVVVGMTNDRVILRSGRTERLATRTSVFTRTWAYGGEWAIVLLKPGELPIAPNPERWISANAAFESTGHRGGALRNYELASQLWPDHSLVWLALGNARYQAGNRDGAETAFKHAVDIDDKNAAALNNLAQTLAERGCRNHARQYLSRAHEVAAPEFLAAIEATQREIAAPAATNDSTQCELR
jgi:tetratricopeptide (TPR) repeat protein